MRTAALILLQIINEWKAAIVIKEKIKRKIWNIKRMWAYIYYRGFASPLLLCGYPDGYAPYEKGYEAYESEKKRYEEKLREFYARYEGVKRRFKRAVPPAYLIRRKKSSVQRYDCGLNFVYKPKNVNRCFMQKRRRYTKLVYDSFTEEEWYFFLPY